MRLQNLSMPKSNSSVPTLEGLLTRNSSSSVFQNYMPIPTKFLLTLKIVSSYATLSLTFIFKQALNLSGIFVRFRRDQPRGCSLLNRTNLLRNLNKSTIKISLNNFYKKLCSEAERG